MSGGGRGSDSFGRRPLVEGGVLATRADSQGPPAGRRHSSFRRCIVLRSAQPAARPHCRGHQGRVTGQQVVTVGRQKRRPGILYSLVSAAPRPVSVDAAGKAPIAAAV